MGAQPLLPPTLLNLHVPENGLFRCWSTTPLTQRIHDTFRLVRLHSALKSARFEKHAEANRKIKEPPKFFSGSCFTRIMFAKVFLP